LIRESIELGSLRENAGNPGGTFKLLWGARRFNFDLVLDFSPGVGTKILSRFILRSRTISASARSSTAGGFLDALFGALKGAPASQRQRSRYERVLDQLGVTPGDSLFLVHISKDEEIRLEKTLEKSGFRGAEPLILLYSPDISSSPGWPVENFAELGTRLANNFGARVVVADEPSDSSLTKLLGPMLPANAIKLGEPEALQLVAAVARVSAVITTAPGLAQLADEFGTPVIDPGTRTVDQVHDETAEVLKSNRTHSLFS
jgi:ADP-heptose:LPS heptosyltransferase